MQTQVRHKGPTPKEPRVLYKKGLNKYRNDNVKLSKRLVIHWALKGQEVLREDKILSCWELTVF